MSHENAMAQASATAGRGYNLPQGASNAGETDAAGAPSPIEHVVIIVKENHTFETISARFREQPESPSPTRPTPRLRIRRTITRHGFTVTTWRRAARVVCSI